MTGRLLVIVGIFSYGLAWLLPAIKVEKDEMSGWQAFRHVLLGNWPDKVDPSLHWYGALLGKASALSNFILAATLLDVFLNSGHPHPVLRTALFACAVLNTEWLFSVGLGDLRISYYLWSGSFFLIAVGLAVSGGGAASWKSTLIVILTTAFVVGIYVACTHLGSHTKASVTDNSERRQYQDTIASPEENKMPHATENVKRTHDDPSSAAEKRLVQDDLRYSSDNWGTVLIKYIVQPLALTATPISLFILTAYLVVQGFQEDRLVGFRSLCGALLPLILITFTHEFGREILIHLGSQKIFWSLIFSSFWGFSLMAILRVFNHYLHNIPLNELILSGSFSVLVFTYYHDERNRAKAYYYGMIAGLLTYIILFGFPVEILHR
jgi:hypothetical protein